MIAKLSNLRGYRAIKRVGWWALYAVAFYGAVVAISNPNAGSYHEVVIWAGWVPLAVSVGLAWVVAEGAHALANRCGRK